MSAAVYVACRVEDLPVPHVASEMRACERCCREVWVDPACLRSATRRQGAEPLLLCMRCAGEVEALAVPVPLDGGPPRPAPTETPIKKSSSRLRWSTRS